MSDDTAEGVKDRLARRFEGEREEPEAEADGSSGDTPTSSGRNSENRGRSSRSTRSERSESSGSAAISDSAESSENTMTSESSKNATNAKKAKNVKEEWKALSVYLPDGIEGDLSRTYKRLDWELESEEGISIKKTRHYYPLVVDLGLERLDEMDSADVRERIDSLQ